jgi:predicted DNA-binding protein with PD1-like motif
MKYSEGKIGRTFILRLEKGDKLPDTIESFADKHKIKSAIVFYLGGADKGSKIIAGPKNNNSITPVPMVRLLKGVSESHGFGTIFLNEEKKPKLHMHASFGRKTKTITGCVRKGVNIWLVGEIVILEILNTAGIRKIDHKSGFELLDF